MTIPQDSTYGRRVSAPGKGGRRLVITDIHGCARTFEALLEKVTLSEADQLFLLGDFINRGPRSKEVLDVVLRLIENGHSVFPLMGNHEENLLHLVSKHPLELIHLLKPRNAKNLLNKHGNVRKRFFRFIRSLPYYYELDTHYLVHAGFNLNIEKPFTDSHAMTWMRNFSMKKKLNGKRVIFGHTPTKWSKIQRMVESNSKAICLDNGCSHTYLGKEYGGLVCYDLGSRKLIRQKNVD